jgi:GAF domain-containing protein
MADTRWKWLLLAGCAFALVWTFATTVDNFGFFAKPWYGYWDAVVGPPPGQSASMVVRVPRADGASARAGLKDGDVLVLGEQNFAARAHLFIQPTAGVPLDLVVRRDSAAPFHLRFLASTTWEGEAVWKALLFLPSVISSLWFIACAALIAIRASGAFDARVLGMTLLCLCSLPFNINSILVPDPALSLLLYGFVQGCGLAALTLLVVLSSHFGARARWRSWIALAGYVAVGLCAALYIQAYYAIAANATVWLPWIASSGVTPSQIPIVALLLGAAISAVATTPISERPRVAWLLLPLPIALAVALASNFIAVAGASWYVLVGMEVFAGIAMLLGALTVTYALLKRRVLDFEFVLGRTLVVATVSLIVLAAFVLLEWLLGNVLTNVSHATGLIANGALALILGLSLRYIHARVDGFVDTVLFRKRHEDERALRDFATEAQYVTDAKALLDRAMEMVRRHTDTRSAEILCLDGGSYVAARSLGDGLAVDVPENDGAILALKAWHKPVDPHHYCSALRGALALPMLSRGRLAGILLLGERAGGEAYAPDELEALSQFASGVGSALHTLLSGDTESIGALKDAIADALATLDATMRALPEAIASRLQADVTPLGN